MDDEPGASNETSNELHVHVDFVVYTKNALHVERIYFDTKFWETKMLPELTSFYFDYLASKLHKL